MSRIEQAFRRAANLQAIDYHATLIRIDEYPKEPGAVESGTGVDRVAPSPALSRQSSDTGRAVTLAFRPPAKSRRRA
jgi:hypothetical protein